MKRAVRIGGLVLGLTVIAAAAVAVVRIGLRNLWGMLLYDQRREGHLAVGDQAPDVGLLTLDGATRVHLRDRVGARPLVLIFGSYT